MELQPESIDEMERRIWRGLSPQRRLEKIAELSEIAAILNEAGMRHRHQTEPDEAVQSRLRALRQPWHKSSY